jgi:exopolysaccharide biosynthesis protein
MLRALPLLLLSLSACGDPAPSAYAPAAADSEAGDTTASTEAVAECSGDWRELDPGIRHRDLCESGEAALHVVEVDPDRWELDAARVEPTTAPALARATGARFAINANFFDPKRRTLGAVVSGGESIQRPHPVSWQSIFFLNEQGEAAIVLPAAWPGAEGVRMAVQAGPRIVVGGKTTDASRATPSMRSGVCLARDRVIFFATAGRLYDVQEIAALAAAPEDGGGIGCRDAMLFDGGPSAQMYLEGSDISIEGDRVPAFVIARPR